MRKGHFLQFACHFCQHPISFSVFEIEKSPYLSCPSCGGSYHCDDETLLRQLRKFENLCRQIQESEEILSQTSVGVFVAGKEVKIPYKLLLTRLNSTLELMIGNRNTSITFRLEPTTDIDPLPQPNAQPH